MIAKNDLFIMDINEFSKDFFSNGECNMAKV